MRISLMIGAAVLALAMPALASQCPSSIAALDDQMRQHGSMLSADKAAQVKGLRDKDEKAHAAGAQDRQRTRMNSSHYLASRMPSSAWHKQLTNQHHTMG